MKPYYRALFFLLLGVVLGYIFVIFPFWRAIYAFRSGTTLDRVIAAGGSEQDFTVYNDSADIQRRASSIPWDVDTTLTPFLGAAPIPGKRSGLEINAQQFRANKDVQMPKPEGVYRIFITGGSTAFGSGAPSNDMTIAGFLEEILNARSNRLRYEVFTAASPGWSSTHERIVIENRISELSPDLVLAFSGNNDVHNGYHCKNSLWSSTLADKLHLFLINQLLSWAFQEELPAVDDVREASLATSEVAAHLSKNMRLASTALGSAPLIFILQPSLPVTHKALSQRESAALQRSERLGASSCKREAGFSAYFRDTYSDIDREMPRQAPENLIYTNLSGIFDKYSEKDEIFLDAYHFGDRGNRIIAEAIAKLAPIP